MEAKSPAMTAVGIAAAVLFALGLVWLIVRLLQGNRSDVLLAGPLVPAQEFQFTHSGEVVLLVEGPRFSRAYPSLAFELVEKETGATTQMKYHVFKDQGAVYGVNTMQVPYGRMTVRAGTYAVRVAGLDPGQDYSAYRLLFSRPFIGRIAFQVVGIVLCSAGMLLSVIWVLWQKGIVKAPPPPPQATAPAAGVPGHTIDLETWKRQQQQQPPPPPPPKK